MYQDWTRVICGGKKSRKLDSRRKLVTCSPAYFVSKRPWMSSESWRSLKKVRMDRRALSTSPQGSLLVKSIPVKGVTVGGSKREASESTSSTRGKGLQAARYSSSNMSKKISSLWNIGIEKIFYLNTPTEQRAKDQQTNFSSCFRVSKESWVNLLGKYLQGLKILEIRQQLRPLRKIVLEDLEYSQACLHGAKLRKLAYLTRCSWRTPAM